MQFLKKVDLIQFDKIKLDQFGFDFKPPNNDVKICTIDILNYTYVDYPFCK